MMYDTLLARSFSKHEQKRLGYGALIASFFVVLSFCTIFKPYLGPLPVLNLRLSIGTEQKLEIVNDTSSSRLKVKEAAEVMANDTLVVGNARSSEEVVDGVVRKGVETSKDSKSSQQMNRDSEIVMKGAPKVNDTKNSLKNAGEIEEKSPVKSNGTSSSRKVPVCSSIMERSDFCEMKGDIRIDGNSRTISIVSSESDILAAENTSWSIRPYARKGDQAAMGAVTEWSVKFVSDRENAPQCTQNHRIPAILFSLGGYSGNHFHAFTDIIVPLFATARPFNKEVQFLITDKQHRWIAKFQKLLDALSGYEHIDIDKGQDVHCFTSLTIGLKGRYRKELSIDPSNSPYTIQHFRQFLKSSYSLKRATAIKIRNGERKRPRLLIISRKRSRAFTNVDEIARMAKKLGFRVVIAESEADVSGFAETINSCDVVLGVHGAGLTNVVFLPENAVLIQVIPFGGAEWVSKTYFEEPLKDMNIRYLEYKIRLEESSLIQQYPSDHVVLRDPSAIQKQGWEAFRSTYLEKQNVKLNVNRIRPTLLKALELLHE